MEILKLTTIRCVVEFLRKTGAARAIRHAEPEDVPVLDQELHRPSGTE